jgi:hypothetical protein
MRHSPSKPSNEVPLDKGNDCSEVAQPMHGLDVDVVHAIV